jgi:hypothetical protein
MAKRVRSGGRLPLSAWPRRWMAGGTKFSPSSGVRISSHGEGRKILWITLWVEDISKYALLDLRLITEI